MIVWWRECRFIRVNLDSSRRKPAAVRALKTQLREAVRTQILDAAEELIAARGLHGAALAQIAKKAGVAVGTLYNYFADRDAMIRALFESRRAALRPKLLAVIGMGQDLKFEARLQQFVRGVLEVFDEHRRFLKVSTETEHYKISPSTIAADLSAALEMMVAAGLAERAIDPKKAPLLVPMIAGTLRSIVLKRVVDGQPFAADADVMVRLFLDGARR
ncbi:MAG TPA: TetR/AcrR family transcriptional regulator [Kofleriaceae bacterium]|nr:TetR/AcrR family transcriptional regulator [Kofleriaceae bacterium]